MNGRSALTAFSILITAALLLLAGSLPAQENGQPAAAPASAPAQPSAIPVPDIAARSIETAAQLRTSATHSRVDPRIQSIESELAGIEAGVRDLARYTEATLKSSPGIGKVSELLSDWQPLISRLDLWAGQLRQRASELERDHDELANAEKEWAATLRAGDSAGLPNEVRSRVESTLASIRDAQRAVAERRSEVVVTQAKVADQRVLADVSIERIRAMESRQRVGLLTIDSVPFWQIFHSTPTTGPVRPERKLNFSANPWFRDYASVVAKQLLVSVVVTILTWFLLLRLRKNTETWQSNSSADVRALSTVVRRPLSSAIFMAVMFSALTWRDVQPWLVSLAGLILLIPSMRLLPGLLAHNLQKAFYMLVSLLVLVEVVGLIPDTSIWSRPVWLAAQVLLAGSLYWLWSTLNARSTPGNWPAFMRHFTAVGVVLAGISALANFVGMVQLSQLLARTILLTYYAAVILRGMLVILTGFMMVSMRTPRLSFISASAERRERVERQTTRVLNFIAAIAFVVTLLYLTTLLDPFRTGLDAFFRTQINLGAVQLTLYNIVSFVLVILGAISTSSILRVVLEVSVYPRFHLQMGQRDAFSKILHYLVLFLGFVFAFAAAGVEFSNIAILAGGLSVGIGLGLQNVVNNFVSGLILLFERPLQIGEVVVVGSTAGFVKDIGIRACVIRTFEGADVIVPNGELVSNQFTNWTHSAANRRIDIEIGAAYGSDPKMVMEVLMRIAKENSLILADPGPEVLFTGFGDSSLNFTLRIWCDKPNWLIVSTQVRTRIAEAFQEAGIEIPFPQRDLHIRSVPENFTDEKTVVDRAAGL